MNENKFIECGSYAKRLSDLASKVLLESDGKLTEQTVQDNILKAYQEVLRILSTYPKIDVANNLSIAIGYMEKNSQMLSLGTLDAQELAKMATNDAIREEINVFNKEDSNKPEKSITGEYVFNDNQEASGTNMSEKIAFLDGISSKENERRYENYFQRAKNGNQQSAIVLGLYRKYSAYIAATKEVTPGTQRGAIALMQRLMAVDDPECKEMAIDLAERFQIDAIEVDNNGKKSVNQSKLDEIATDKLGKANGAYLNTNRTIYNKMNQSVCMQISQEISNIDTVTKFLSETEIRAKKIAGRVEFNKFSRADNIDKKSFNQFAAQYPDISKSLLLERIIFVNKLQQNSSLTSVQVEKMNQDILRLNESLSHFIQGKDNKEENPIIKDEGRRDNEDFLIL